MGEAARIGPRAALDENGNIMLPRYGDTVGGGVNGGIAAGTSQTPQFPALVLPRAGDVASRMDPRLGGSMTTENGVTGNEIYAYLDENGNIMLQRYGDTIGGAPRPSLDALAGLEPNAAKAIDSEGTQGIQYNGNEIAVDSLKTDDIISLYRAVGPNEYYSVVGSGKFNTVPTGMEVKQFGLDRQDTINFAERYPDIVAVLEVKIPKGILNNIGDFTKVDTTIFRSGTVTIQPENLDIFNKYLKEILHIY